MLGSITESLEEDTSTAIDANVLLQPVPIHSK